LTIRLAVSGLRVMGRATQGVRLITLRGEDSIAAVAKVEVEVDEEINDIQDENVDFIEDDSNNESGNE
jgi:DNA gyrase subunit A